MATTTAETKASETTTPALQSLPKKKQKPTGTPSANALFVNATQHRAIRFVSFMLEESKHETNPIDFLEEALARHFLYYQSKRGIEFPPKMLAEIIPVGFVFGKSTPEE